MNKRVYVHTHEKKMFAYTLLKKGELLLVKWAAGLATFSYSFTMAHNS